MTRAQRDARIIRCRVKYGWTYQRIADHFGLASRQRAWQIVTKNETRPFWCDAERGAKLCLRKRGHKGAHKYGVRQIVTKAGKA